MRHEVKYSGYSANPSDYDSLEGELAAMNNIIYRDGALRSIAPPTVEVDHGGSRLHYGVWFHQTASFKHMLVVRNTNILCWKKQTDGVYTEIPINDFGEVHVNDIAFIGNVVVVICDDSIHYILWSEKDKGYVYLDNIPECSLSFGLQGEVIYTEDIGNIPDDEDGATSLLLAKANKFIADEVTNKGRFIFPFFVRYAYRMFDGSLTHHSAPILMFPSTTQALITRTGSNSSVHQIYAYASYLDYKCLTSKEQLLKWKDVIKSVDIFISAPIYNYDQNGKVQISSSPTKETDSCFVGADRSADDGVYKIWNLGEAISGVASKYVLPTRTLADIEQDVRDCHQFYLFKSIPIESLVTEERTPIFVDSEFLQSLVTREAMTDDYQSHDLLLANFSQVYNGRLNIANIQRKLYNGYDPASMVCYRNETSAGAIRVRTFITADNGNVALTREAGDALTWDFNTFSYLYYPDISAYGMEVLLQKASPAALSASLMPHSFLNGSFYFFKFPTTEVRTSSENGSFSYDDGAVAVKTIPNKLYTSEVNNPFYFPVSTMNSIGTGELLGICSAAKALSTGQFGQFPLYAFTSEGVWALSVSSDGTFIPAQPFTRDVCIFPNSITQLDSSVIFTTDRGIMLLSGSDCLCISEILDGNPTMKELEHCSLFMPQITFREYLKNAGYLYDYVNQRIIVFNGTYNYAYVYSLESKSWGMMDCDIWKPVKSYPEAYGLTKNGDVLNYSVLDETQEVTCSIISRPIRCMDGNTLKTITSLIQRGNFREGSVQTLLYGSRNFFDWHLVSSSKNHILRGWRGTPYKYFRVALQCTLKNDESISGCSIEFEPRLTNKMR